MNTRTITTDTVQQRPNSSRYSSDGGYSCLWFVQVDLWGGGGNQRSGFDHRFHNQGGRTVKHCTIRQQNFKGVMQVILQLKEAGIITLWRCKKVGEQWQATSVKPIAHSVEQLQKVVS